MNVYQFSLPIMSNDGLVDYHRALQDWEHVALEEVGGYTDLSVRHGVWREGGKTYSENMQTYQVAFRDGDAGDLDRLRLLKAAQDLFPDQVAFYVAHVGTAEIIYKTPSQRWAQEAAK